MNKSIDTRKRRKIVSIVWLSRFMRRHRHTVAKEIRQEKVDLWDMESILLYILRHSEYIKLRRGDMPHWFFGRYFDPIEFSEKHNLPIPANAE